MDTLKATTDERERRGWTRAAVGCYWTRGEFMVYTIASSDGQRRGYNVHRNREQLGDYLPDWSDVEYLCNRRMADRRAS